MRELTIDELGLVAGGIDLAGYRTSTNVRDQTCDLQSYRIGLDAMVSSGQISSYDADLLMGARIQQCTAQIRR
jgi:hypothetical protein